jgi:hypothetical protein
MVSGQAEKFEKYNRCGCLLTKVFVLNDLLLGDAVKIFLSLLGSSYGL